MPLLLGLAAGCPLASSPFLAWRASHFSLPRSLETPFRIWQVEEREQFAESLAQAKRESATEAMAEIAKFAALKKQV